MVVRNFGWLIDGEIAASGLPRNNEEWGWLKEQRIGAVLSLTELPASVPTDVSPVSLWLPILDAGTPSEEQIDRAVVFLDEQRGQRRPVLVHCLAGLGRTGTILACYLVAKGASADEAIRQVRARRPGSIETDWQMATVFGYALRGQ